MKEINLTAFAFVVVGEAGTIAAGVSAAPGQDSDDAVRLKVLVLCLDAGMITLQEAQESRVLLFREPSRCGEFTPQDLTWLKSMAVSV